MPPTVGSFKKRPAGATAGGRGAGAEHEVVQRRRLPACREALDAILDAAIWENGNDNLIGQRLGKAFSYLPKLPQQRQTTAEGFAETSLKWRAHHEGRQGRIKSLIEKTFRRDNSAMMLPNVDGRVGPRSPTLRSRPFSAAHTVKRRRNPANSKVAHNRNIERADNTAVHAALAAQRCRACAVAELEEEQQEGEVAICNSLPWTKQEWNGRFYVGKSSMGSKTRLENPAEKVYKSRPKSAPAATQYYLTPTPEGIEARQIGTKPLPLIRLSEIVGNGQVLAGILWTGELAFQDGDLEVQDNIQNAISPATSVVFDSDPFDTTATKDGGRGTNSGKIPWCDQFIDFPKALDEEPQARNLPQNPTLEEITLQGLRGYSIAEVRLLLIQLGFRHYSDQIYEIGVNGEDLSVSNEFDLSRMGITYRPHRMRLLKFLDGIRRVKKSKEGPTAADWNQGDMVGKSKSKKRIKQAEAAAAAATETVARVQMDGRQLSQELGKSRLEVLHRRLGANNRILTRQERLEDAKRRERNEAATKIERWWKARLFRSLFNICDLTNILVQAKRLADSQYHKANMDRAKLLQSQALLNFDKFLMREEGEVAERDARSKLTVELITKEAEEKERRVGRLLLAHQKMAFDVEEERRSLNILFLVEQDFAIRDDGEYILSRQATAEEEERKVKEIAALHLENEAKMMKDAIAEARQKAKEEEKAFEAKFKAGQEELERRRAVLISEIDEGEKNRVALLQRKDHEKQQTIDFMWESETYRLEQLERKKLDADAAATAEKERAVAARFDAIERARLAAEAAATAEKERAAAAAAASTLEEAEKSRIVKEAARESAGKARLDEIERDRLAAEAAATAEKERAAAIMAVDSSKVVCLEMAAAWESDRFRLNQLERKNLDAEAAAAMVSSASDKVQVKKVRILSPAHSSGQSRGDSCDDDERDSTSSRSYTGSYSGSESYDSRDYSYDLSNQMVAEKPSVATENNASEALFGTYAEEDPVAEIHETESVESTTSSLTMDLQQNTLGTDGHAFAEQRHFAALRNSTPLTMPKTDSDWIEIKEDRKSTWFNKKTREVSNHPPEAQLDPVGGADPEPNFVEHYDPVTKSKYYYSLLTRTTSWTRPPGF